MSPKVVQYTIIEGHLVQLDGFDTYKTKKTKQTENIEKGSTQQNDYRNVVTVKNKYFFFGCFCLANAPASDKKDLLSELELMKKLKPHPHVIKLLGCVTETGKRCVEGVKFQFLEICVLYVFLVMIVLPIIRMIERFNMARSYRCTLIGIKANVHIT